MFFVMMTQVGCNPPADSFATLNESQGFSGHIIVANSLSKSVVLLNSEGAVVRSLAALDKTSAEFPAGVGLYNNNREVLVTIEGGADRVGKSTLDSGVFDQGFIINGNLTGTLRGITQLVGGDIIVTEGGAIERFINPGLRQTTGWPITPVTGGATLRPVASTGGFIHCAYTSDVIRVYSSTGTQTATQVSGIVGTTDAFGCGVSPENRVAVAWNGTTDTVRIYQDLTLTNGTASSYSNLTLLGNPQALDFLPNGNVIVADFTNNLLVEVSATGTLVRTIASPGVAGPISLVVVP